MMERIALLDFDDTLIRGDSLRMIMKGEGWLLAPSLWLAGAGIVLCRFLKKDELKARSRFKFRMLKKYAGMKEEKKKAYIRRLRERIRPEILDELEKENYDRLVVISASEEELIRNVLDGVLQADLIIANRTEGKEKSFCTCYGIEKCRRLEEALPHYRNCEISVYTDSWSDRPLMDIAARAFLVSDSQLQPVKGEAA